MDALRPLAGLRVLVTRPREQASDFVRRLETLGAEVSVLPVIGIESPTDWSGIDVHLNRLRNFDWFIFSSANGVRAFFDRLTALELSPSPDIQMAAVGPATADALIALGHSADLVPVVNRAENLAAELAPRAAGQRILIVRGDQSRGVLRRELAKFSLVDEVIVYRQSEIVDRSDPIFARLAAGQIDFVTLTSSNIARSFLQALGVTASALIQSGTVRLVSISPVTSATIRDLDFPVAVEARRYSTEGMLESLVEYASET